MLKKWFGFQQPFSIPPYQFQIFRLWQEAFKEARPVWLRLLVADFILIVLFHLPMLMPVFLKWFPFLHLFTLAPPWGKDPLYAHFTQLSENLFPLLFAIFILMPVYLGINLFALRVVYQRPAPLSLLAHYLGFFWWTNVMSVLVLAIFAFFPFVFFIVYLVGKTLAVTHAPQYYLGMIISVGMILLLWLMFSMALNLVFAARMSVVHAAKMSWVAVNQHKGRILGMLIISYAIWVLGQHTNYLSDIILMPPNAIAWALLYKRIFGERGLVE